MFDTHIYKQILNIYDSVNEKCKLIFGEAGCEKWEVCFHQKSHAYPKQKQKTKQ